MSFYGCFCPITATKCYFSPESFSLFNTSGMASDNETEGTGDRKYYKVAKPIHEFGKDDRGGCQK